MKSVLMLYPIKQYVERDPRIFLEPIGIFWTRILGISMETFRERFRLINILLDEYRSKDYIVHWVFYSNPKNPELPDESQFCDIFQMKEDDRKISVGLTYKEHYNGFCPDEKKILQSIKNLNELVVGGFHLNPCVGRFYDAGNELGINTTIDNLLTDQFFQKIENTFGEDLYLLMIKNGKLDPVIHEDDPNEMKKIWLDHRLDNYL